ncbi:MAG: ABC transporter substrate-binding protein [Acidimicrobiales bacterium]
MSRVGVALIGLLAAAAVVACGGGGPAAPKAKDRPFQDGPCPSRLVVQTDWFPEVEHGALYQLVGSAGVVDKAALTYRGPLAGEYRGPHGVREVEIRAGGAAIEFKRPIDVLYDDPAVTLAYTNTDDAIRSAGTRPVVQVAASLDLSPQILMWNPFVHDIKGFDDIARTGVKVRYAKGLNYMDYLVASGHVKEAQLDPSYDGSPAKWLESGGSIIQQGFATNEVYLYTEGEVGWKKPVDFLLVHWSGYEAYPQAYTVRADRVGELSPCLRLFVPVLQQAAVDFFADPQPVSEQLVEIVEAQSTFWQISKRLNQKAVEIFDTFEIAGNGPDTTYGNFDDKRMERFTKLMTGLFQGKANPVKPGLRADEVYTNAFIDPSIGRRAGQ